MSYIGTNKIGGMYLGTTEISKAYLGTDLVYQKETYVPVFYDYLLFDGTAYIDTQFYPQLNSCYYVTFGGELNKSAQRLLSVTSSDGTYVIAQLGTSTNATNRSVQFYYNSSSVILTQTLSFGPPQYGLFMTPKGCGWGTAYYTYTKGSGSPNGRLIIGNNSSGSNNSYSGAMNRLQIYDSSAEDVVSDTGFSSFTPYKTLRPCDYGSRSGLWDVEANRFYGNSAGSGTLTACWLKSSNITSYDTTDYSYASFQNPSNTYTAYSSSTYATVNLKTGSGAETWVYFNFNVSSIPSDATILRVVCTARILVSVNNVNYIATRTIQPYCGNTAKGSASTINATSATYYPLNCGTWTRSELDNFRLKLYAKRGTRNVTDQRYYRFYGATLQVYWR